MVRDYNFSRVVCRIRAAQLVVFGNLHGQAGPRVSSRNIAAVGIIFQTERSGKLKSDLLNEIEAIWGFGTD